MKRTQTRPSHHGAEPDHNRQRFRLLGKLVVAMLPFFLVLLGLALISVGAFRYVENESVLSLFLLNRDSAVLHTWSGEQWSAYSRPAEEPLPPMDTHIIEPEPEEPGERLIVPFYYIGQQFATLRIPSIEMELPVFQGDREEEFRRGVGHYPGSFFPGQDGNILLAAHRTSHFRSLEHIKVGDLVYLDTTYGKFSYVVDEIRITEGNDQSIADDTPFERLTMYTCYPFVYFGNAPQRFVVIGSLLEEEVYR